MLFVAFPETEKNASSSSVRETKTIDDFTWNAGGKDAEVGKQAKEAADDVT
jgi:hypothetical protein